MNQMYRVETFDPLVIRDARTGRFVDADRARSWCAENGHVWGELWPTREWIDREMDASKSKAAVLNAQRRAIDPDAPYVSAALWIPASSWSCECCGRRLHKGDAESPDEAIVRDEANDSLFGLRTLIGRRVMDA